MRVCITGAAGYIGSALLEELCTWKGVDLFAVDKEPAGVPGVCQGDILELETQQRIAEFEPDVIFNLAAVSSTREAEDKDEDEVHDTNCAAAVELSSICPEALFVQASSLAVTYVGVRDAYAQSKWDAELKLAGWRTLVVRLGTVVGTVPGTFAEARTRWDTPANAMVRSAVVQRAGWFLRDVFRPFVSLDTVVGFFAEVVNLVQDYGRDVFGLQSAVPLCDSVLLLEEVADLVWNEVGDDVTFEGKEAVREVPSYGGPPAGQGLAAIALAIEDAAKSARKLVRKEVRA